MQITLVRKFQSGGLFGSKVYFGKEKKATLRFCDDYFYVGKPDGDIRIRSAFFDEIIIPVSILKEDNLIYLQNVKGFFFNSVQAIVTVNGTVARVYKSEKTFFKRY